MTQPNPFVDALLKDVESVANALFASLQEPAEAPQEAPTEPEAVTVDPLSEVYRILKKSEEAASGRENESELLLNIATSYSRIVEAALIYQN